MLCILFQSSTPFTLIVAQLCWWPYSLILRRCNRCESTLSGCWEPLPPVTLNPHGGPPVNSTTRPPDILLENHILILTMVGGWSVKGWQEKFHKSHKGGKNVAFFGAILANWGNFLSSIKIPRPWQVMQGILRRQPKVHCFHLQIESKDCKRRFMLSHLGVLCWLLYFTGGDGIHELPIQMELFTDRDWHYSVIST